MNHLVQTLFVSDGRVARRQVRKFRVLQVAADETMYGEVSVVESKRGFERLFSVRETMTCKVHPLVLAQLICDLRDARIFPLDAREISETIDTLADIRQFGADGNEFTCTGCVCLTNGNEPFLYRPGGRRTGSSGTNEGGQGGSIRRDIEPGKTRLAFPIWGGSMQGQKRELGGGTPPDAGLARICCQEEIGDGGNDLVPEFPQEDAKVLCHVRPLCEPN